MYVGAENLSECGGGSGPLEPRGSQLEEWQECSQLAKPTIKNVL